MDIERLMLERADRYLLEIGFDQSVVDELGVDARIAIMKSSGSLDGEYGPRQMVRLRGWSYWASDRLGEEGISKKGSDISFIRLCTDLALLEGLPGYYTFKTKVNKLIGLYIKDVPMLWGCGFDCKKMVRDSHRRTVEWISEWVARRLQKHEEGKSE